MNAHTPAPVLTPHLVQNIEVLQALAAAEPHASIAALAQAIGRDPANLSKTLRKLEEEAAVLWPPGAPLPGLSASGRGALDAWARAHAEPGLLGDDVQLVAFDRIVPWELNPRTTFDAASVEEMAQSIADKGVLQPLIVRRRGEAFEVVIGERRRRGATLAVAQGWVAADFLVPCRVRPYTDDEAFEVAGVENLQREDLHWMDEARFYLRLMERGKSGSDIERLVGGRRGKRSIQDYAKIAKELAAEDVERVYLPDGDPQHLSYVRARDMVGEKRDRPALDLTPKLALTLLELIAAATGQGGAPEDRELVAKLHRAPSGGPISTLSDRRLLAWRFVDGQPAAVVAVTEDVRRWLDQVGWSADPQTALLDVRAAVIGELEARLVAAGEYLTPELQPPGPAQAEPPPLLDAGPAPLPAPDPPLGLPGLPQAPPPAVEPEEDDDEDAADEPPAPPTVHQAPAPAAYDLPPMVAVTAIEIAHKIGRAGIERGPGTWACEVRESYYKDGGALGGLVQKHKAAAFMALNRDKTVVALHAKALDWLNRTHGIEVSDTGRPSLSDERLAELQALYGLTPVEGGPYGTYWLNAPAAAPAVEAPPPAAEPRPEPRRDAFSSAIVGLAAERRAISSLAAAARDAAAFLASLKTRSKAAKPEEIEPHCARLEAALDAVRPLLEEDGEA